MERVNGIIIDWLSITSKTLDTEDFMDLLGITSGWQYVERGVHGYSGYYFYGSIKVHSGGLQDNTWLEMSGQGCRSFESDSIHKNWDVIFDILKNPLNQAKITRLDIAYDDFSGIFDIERICDDVRPRTSKLKARTNYVQVVESSNGMSCDIGSPKSLIMVRFYDKRSERLSKIRGKEDKEKIKESIPHWVRCELQLRDERAAEFVKYLQNDKPVTVTNHPLTIGEAFRGVLDNYIDFGYEVPARGNPKKKVWHRFPYWQNFLDDASKISLYRKTEKGYNLERAVNFVQNNAGNAIDAVLHIYGPAEFMSMIADRKISQSKKYQDLMNQHGSYTDRLEAQMQNYDVEKWLNSPLLSSEELNELREERIAEREKKHAMLQLFSQKRPIVWNGVRHLMCECCQEIMPAAAFPKAKWDSNFAKCFKCEDESE